VRDHAARQGWSAKQTNDVRRSLRLVQALQHTRNARINPTDVLKARDRLPPLRFPLEIPSVGVNPLL